MPLLAPVMNTVFPANEGGGLVKIGGAFLVVLIRTKRLKEEGSDGFKVMEDIVSGCNEEVSEGAKFDRITLQGECPRRQTYIRLTNKLPSDSDESMEIGE